jgi:hypothetical protein
VTSTGRDGDPHGHAGRQRLLEVVRPAQLGLDLEAVAREVDRVVETRLLAVGAQPQRQREPVADGKAELAVADRSIAIRGHDPAVGKRRRLRRPVPARWAQLGRRELEVLRLEIRRLGPLDDPGRARRLRLGQQQRPRLRLGRAVGDPPPVGLAGRHLDVGQQRLVGLREQAVRVDAHEQLAAVAVAEETGLDAHREERHREAGVEAVDQVDRGLRQPGDELADRGERTPLVRARGLELAEGAPVVALERLPLLHGRPTARRLRERRPRSRELRGGDAALLQRGMPLLPQAADLVAHGASSGGSMSEPWIATRNGRWSVM